MKKILTLLFLILLLSHVKASHYSGGNITYQWIGPTANDFYVELSLYYDCSSPLWADNSILIDVKSTCGMNYQFYLYANLSNLLEITPLCTSQMNQSECQGGALPGRYYIKYEGYIEIDSTCASWTISHSTCCYNDVTNINGAYAEDFYYNTTFNTSEGQFNKSPEYDSVNYFYTCANQTYHFNLGVFDADGDSLKHEFVSAMINSSTNIQYASGFSGLQPIPGITINNASGLITVTPANIGIYLITVKTSEYNHLGQLKGTTLRMFDLVVRSCVNNQPSLNSGNIINVSSNASINTNGGIDFCNTDSLIFTAQYIDIDSLDTLSIQTNLDNVLGASNYYYTVSGTNPLLVEYHLSVPSNMNNFNFITTITDNNCTEIGAQNYQHNFQTIIETNVANVPTLCGNQAVQLTATGGNVFNWYDTLGNLIPVSAAFSCNPCANPIVSVAATTTFIVQSDIISGCAFTDTITVYHSNDIFTIAVQNDSATCLYDPIALNCTPDVPGNYSFIWGPDSLIDNTTLSNPLFLATFPGSFWINISVTNSIGCVVKDSMQIVVSENPLFEAVAISDTVCIGSANQLEVIVSPISTNLNCALSIDSCQSGSINTIIGQDSLLNNNFTYPAVFGNSKWGAKHQMLYKASELNVMGLVAGAISSISFYVASLNFSSSFYNNISIQLKCSQTNVLNTFETGMISMLNLPSYNVHLGWNTFYFNNNYYWDGISNLIVQFCFNNSYWSGNCSNTYTITPFNSVLYYRGDITTVCQSALATVSDKRPNIKFGFCSPSFSPSDYTINWSPSSSLNNSAIYNPLTTVPSATTYQVIVTDIVGGCSDTATVLAQNNGVNGALAPVILFNNQTLSTDPAYAYQWFYNGVAIAGADSASIVPVLNGDYTVQIFDSTVCSAFSAPYTLTVANANIIDANSIQIFPNPANNFIDIRINGAINKYLVQIISIDGSQVKEVLVDKTDRIQLDNMANGVYFIKIKNTNNNTFEQIKKLIILH